MPGTGEFGPAADEWAREQAKQNTEFGPAADEWAREQVEKEDQDDDGEVGTTVGGDEEQDWEDKKDKDQSFDLSDLKDVAKDVAKGAADLLKGLNDKDKGDKSKAAEPQPPPSPPPWTPPAPPPSAPPPPAAAPAPAAPAAGASPALFLLGGAGLVALVILVVMLARRRGS